MIRTPEPKLRMVAGPNGSGKSTLFQNLRTHHSFPFGFWLNPDEIDRELRLRGCVYLGSFGVRFDDASLESFVKGHGLAKRLTDPLPRVKDNGLVVDLPYTPGYFTSLFCDFLRRQWIARDESFTFETVMSHPDRLDVLREARAAGYRTYLYFICTESDRIDSARVARRVAAGGHDVPSAALSER